MKHFSLRSHTNEQLGIVSADGEPCYLPPNPFNWPIGRGTSARLVRLAAAECEQLGEILPEAEVVAICREHFKTFGTLQDAARHYGLTDGRLSQIQNGIYVSCPRILKALGINYRRGGVYRRVTL